MNRQEREKGITRTSMIGVLANVFLVIFKVLAGTLAGSIAIVLDAVNNLADALSSVITVLGIKLAKKKPDHKHPFGYGRIEYFSTIIIAILILTAGGTSLLESIRNIMHPQLPDYQKVTIVIVVASVVMKLLLGKYVKGQGRKYHSDALIASGQEAGFDAIVSAATLLGAVTAIFFHFSIDAWIAAVISVFILKAGLEMLLETLDHVVGSRPDSELTKAMKEEIRSIDGVIGAYDLILHNYGPDQAIGSVHVEVLDTWDAAQIDHLTRKIQNKVLERFHIFLTVGIYAVGSRGTEQFEMKHKIAGMIKDMPGVLNLHGLYLDQENKILSFDLSVDFTVKDPDRVQTDLIEKIRKLYPDYRVAIQIDNSYSD